MAKILELQHQPFQWVFRVDFPQDWLVWSRCCPRDSQEFSPNLNSKALAFSLLYDLTLTSIHGYWRDHSFDYVNLCWQNDVFAFSHSKFVIAFLPTRKCLLISWLQSPFTVILESKKRKSVSSQFQRRTMLKNVQTTKHLCLLPMLVRLCSKSFQWVFRVDFP